MTQNHIIENFTDSCLEDISNKLLQLSGLQIDATQRLRGQAETRIDYISKVFIDLEDLVVKLLRQKIKVLFTQQQNMLAQQLKQYQLEVSDKIQQKGKQLQQIKEKIESHQPQTKKLLGRFAQGKVEKNWEQFKEEILFKIQLPNKKIEYDREELEDLIDQMIELLNIKHKKDPSVVARNLQSARTNNSHLSSFSKRTSKQLAGIKNQSVISQVISELPSEDEPYQSSFRNKSSMYQRDYFGDSAIQQHKQTKTIKRRQKMQRQLNKNERQTKTINTVAQLVLQKQKLLKQLE